MAAVDPALIYKTLASCVIATTSNRRSQIYHMYYLYLDDLKPDDMTTPKEKQYKLMYIFMSYFARPSSFNFNMASYVLTILPPLGVCIK